MPLVGAPTFSPGVLSADQLNSLVALLEAKFGAIGTADIGWPLTAGGNIDMAQFELLHLARLWNVRNLAERDSSTTLQDVLDDIDSEGGGVALLPANETETVGTGGVTIGPNTLIAGQGHTSIFAVTGVLTNHTFRNKTEGDSGIYFLNCKITNEDSSGGAFNLVHLVEATTLKFVDVKFVNERAYAVGLSATTAGNPCIDSWFDRCIFDISGTGGILLEDVNNVDIGKCKLELSGSAVGIVYSAEGIASDGVAIKIRHNYFDFESGSTASGIVMSGSSSNHLQALAIDQNDFNCVGDVVSAIDVHRMVSADVHPHSIDGNKIFGDGTCDFGIRVRQARNFSCNNNRIEVGGGFGILLGADARSGTATAVSQFQACFNNVHSSDAAMVLVHPGVLVPNNFAGSTVFGNTLNSDNSQTTGGDLEIWNLGADPTTRTAHIIISANFSRASAAVGTMCFVAMGTDRGGQFGEASDSYLVWQGNVSPNTLIGAAGNDDFAATDTTTDKCLTDADDAGASTDNIRT